MGRIPQLAIANRVATLRLGYTDTRTHASVRPSSTTSSTTTRSSRRRPTTRPPRTSPPCPRPSRPLRWVAPTRVGTPPTLIRSSPSTRASSSSTRPRPPATSSNSRHSSSPPLPGPAVAAVGGGRGAAKASGSASMTPRTARATPRATTTGPSRASRPSACPRRRARARFLPGCESLSSGYLPVSSRVRLC